MPHSGAWTVERSQSNAGTDIGSNFGEEVNGMRVFDERSKYGINDETEILPKFVILKHCNKEIREEVRLRADGWRGSLVRLQDKREPAGSRKTSELGEISKRRL